MVHQELAFCPDLSVAENLCMGQYPRRFGLLDRGAMRERANALLARIGVSLDVSVMMRDLSTAQEQLVQIASAVGGRHFARAVGQALAANPVPLVIPCHRVVASGGGLGGFTGGLGWKRRLLALERGQQVMRVS